MQSLRRGFSIRTFTLTLAVLMLTAACTQRAYAQAGGDQSKDTAAPEEIVTTGAGDARAETADRLTATDAAAKKRSSSQGRGSFAATVERAGLGTCAVGRGGKYSTASA